MAMAHHRGAEIGLKVSDNSGGGKGRGKEIEQNSLQRHKKATEGWLPRAAEGDELGRRGRGGKHMPMERG